MRSSRPAAPTDRFSAPVAWAARIAALLAALSMAAEPAAGQSEPTPMRLRVTLSAAQQPMTWRGEAWVTDGEVLAVQPLRFDAEAAAGLSLDAGRAAIHHRRPQTVDYFDLTVSAAPGAELVVQLQDASGQPLPPARLPLDGARRFEAVGVPIDTQRSIHATRLPSDRVRIVTDRESLVFAPGEEFAFEVFLEPEGVSAGETVTVAASLRRGRDGPAVWNGEAQRVVVAAEGPTRAQLSVAAPAAEGVYTLKVAATRPAGFGSRLLPIANGGAGSLAEQSTQLAVFDPQAEPKRVGSWRETYAFDPRTQRWADRLPDWIRWRRLPWFAAGPLGSEPGAPRSDAGGDWVRIAPAPAPREAHWRAYPLPIEAPGALYAVEVETSGETGDQLTIALLEPNAFGELAAVGDGVTRVEPRWNRKNKGATARALVRPQTASPLLVIANPNPAAPARFGKIRLLRGVEEPSTPPATQRVVAIDWTDPDLGHAVGATHTAGAAGLEAADLVTHWETARALADRVEAAGANAAVIPLNRDGAAIYPSRHWQSPRYDVLAWSDAAPDTPRRELLGLVAREFARRGLRIVPAVRLDAPCPAGETAGGDQPLDGPPYYDALAERIAALRESVVDEALDAAGPDAPLAGLAIRFTPQDWAAPRDAALESGAEAPPGYAASYERLAARLAERGLPSDSLFFAPSGLAARQSLARGATPRLATTKREPPPAVGLLRSTGAATIATPYALSDAWRTTGGVSSGASLWALQKALDPLHESSARIVHAARGPLLLTGSAERLARGDADARKDIVVPTVEADPSGEASALAHAAVRGVKTLLLDTAATAGWLDDAAAQQRRLLSALPVDPRGPSPRTGDDAVVAVGHDTPTGSVVSITNLTPWPQKASLTIHTDERVQGSALRAASGEPEEGRASFTPGQHARAVELAPHETAAWSFSQPGVTAAGVRVEPQPLAQKELAVALEDLRARDTTRRRDFDAITNASFEAESTEASAPPGWTLGPGAAISTAAAYDGSASVSLRVEQGRPAEIASEPFSGPTTGQLVLFVRARSDGLTPGSQLWVGVEQTDGAYRNGGIIEGDGLTAQDSADGDAAWLPIVVPISDLPLSDTLSLRVRVALRGAGEVRLDDFRAEDLILPRDGYAGFDLQADKLALVRLYKEAEDLLAQQKLDACRELLDGYWARFLTRNFPRRDPEPPSDEAIEPLADGQRQPPAAEEPNPSLSERVRGWFSWR